MKSLTSLPSAKNEAPLRLKRSAWADGASRNIHLSKANLVRRAVKSFPLGAETFAHLPTCQRLTTPLATVRLLRPGARRTPASGSDC